MENKKFKRVKPQYLKLESMTETTDPIEKVAEFHLLFNHPILLFPTIPGETRCVLRQNLLREELEEFSTAIAEGNLKEILDSFCDLQYVLSGAILEFGMQEIFWDAFKEVHRSNLSKSCATEEEAQRTVDKSYEEHGNCYYVVRNGRYFVYRSIDNKTIKSINYSPANLKQFIR